MKITLISLDRELLCFSIRTLSACLKRAGHDVQLVFLMPGEEVASKNKYRTMYSDELLYQLSLLCMDCDLIGISLMSNQFIQAIDVTKGLKARSVSAPVVWGGIQPTIEPKECLKYADLVCLGEGEEVIAELADKMEKRDVWQETMNIWCNTPDGIVKNEVRPLIQDLDSVPYPDYSCRNHFVSHGDKLVELSKEEFVSFQGERFKSKNGKIVYMLMTSRGCPYNCTYCANSVYRKMYARQKLVRWRSPENVIGEIKMIQEQIAPVSYVYMVDDNFTARPVKSLLAFCKKYKKEINVPFFAQVSPLTIDDEKMKILFDNGCAHITMGVETASKRIAAMYNRTKAHRVMEKAIAAVEKYRYLQTPPPTYQFIIDNPYETIDEMRQTLKMACSFPRPWHNPIYSLMMFPGTPLFYKAMADGIITDKYSQIYGRNWRSQSNPYFQIWIKLYHANIHPLVLKAMLMQWVVQLFTSRLCNSFFKSKWMRRLWENPS